MANAERGTRLRGPPGAGAITPGSPLKYLPGVGPRKAELLRLLGLDVVADLIAHFPRRYEDRRHLVPLREAEPGEGRVVWGEIARVNERSLSRGRSIVEALLVEPGTAAVPARALARDPSLHLVWFNQPYLLEFLRPGVRLHAFGQIKRRAGVLQMPAPEFEIDAGDEGGEESSPHVKRIVPIYPLTRGLHQRFLRGLIHRVLASDLSLPETPYDHFHPGKLSALDGYRLLHFPAGWEDASRARARLVFDEYFVFASHLAFRRRACRRPRGTAFQAGEELDRKIRSLFAFRFTPEQDQAVADIRRDLAGDAPMYRLLQGDVGTGKTAVAIYALLVAVRNGCQAALMAPTEVLAEQHHRTLTAALAKYRVRVALLTGSAPPAVKKRLLAGIADGREHIVVGTHALVQDAVHFKRLGLIVIDEQHRFGVRERMRLRKKGGDPHVLVMTATPIPRSLCLTAYGDLDLSLLRNRPAGRPPVKTTLVSARERPRALEFLRGELAKGRQAYFIYPLIDESEALALPAAVRGQAELARGLPGHRIGLVHGDLPPARKEEELDRFRRGEYQVLVATVVVEVGIDVPNATLLFIEDASRFGLAQLHQLRGRVGRGSHPGHCFVAVDSASREVRQRLRVFAATEDGFRIAEEDLRLRGPGDFLGVRQSGKPHFLLGNPLEDLPEYLRVKARAEAFWADSESSPYRERWAGLLDLDPPGAKGEGFVGLD
jgi:ATP-dependent DNA helicase RecG